MLVVFASVSFRPKRYGVSPGNVYLNIHYNNMKTNEQLNV